MDKKAAPEETPRHARRVVTQVSGRYLAQFEDGWIDCEVIDLSIDGAALRIPVPAGEPLGHLLLELLCDGQPASPQFRAAVRNWQPAGDGYLRVGVEFIATTNLERYTLANLVSSRRRAS